MHLQISSSQAWQRAPRYALTGVWTDPVRPLAGCDCGCEGSCGMGALGDMTLTPEAAVQQAIQGESSGDFSAPSWLSGAAADVAAGQIPAQDFSPNCAGMPAPNLNLFTTASGLALSATATGASIATATGALAAGTGALLGAATMGAGLIVSVIGMIFAHHAAAVKQEQQLGCAAIAAFNNAISVIDQAVAAGQTTPAAAASALDTLVSQVAQYVSPSVQHNPCNADCELTVLVKAIVLYKKAIYSNMAAASTATAATLQQQAAALQQQAATASAQGNTTQAAALTQQANTLLTQAASVPSSGPPSWLWLAAAGLAAFLVMR